MTLRLDRIERQEEVLVDVISCLELPDLNDTAMACRILDVSKNGMFVSTNLNLPVNTLLGLRLDLQTQLYRLEGRVRWSREDESFNVGLLINDQSQDFSAWTEMFELDF